jgi:hypothetical protein
VLGTGAANAGEAGIRPSIAAPAAAQSQSRLVISISTAKFPEKLDFNSAAVP